jgi:hypothetical protein
MESCIICYQEDINLILPPCCNCKVYLHIDCFEIMKNKMNLICPLCRKKEINIIIIERNFPSYSRILFCLVITGMLLILLFFLLIYLLIKNSLIIIPYFIIYYIFF